LKLAYEIHGDPKNPIIVLVQGLGMPLTATPPELVEKLVNKQLCLLLIDNRDIGQSEKFDHAPPNIIWQAIKHQFGFKVKSFYKLDNMMSDINELLIKLNIKSAHILGVSMGGMIAQLMAIYHPNKIKSLISIMSTTGDPTLPGPKWAVAKFILMGSRNKDIHDSSSFYHQLWKLIGSPKYPRSTEELNIFVERIMARGMTTGGSARQLLAILTSRNRCSDLQTLAIPTLIIHGDEDNLVPVECGINTAESIKNSILWRIPGMGHDFPYELIDEFTDRISQHVLKADKGH